MLWPLEVTHVGAYHRPSDVSFLTNRTMDGAGSDNRVKMSASHVIPNRQLLKANALQVTLLQYQNPISLEVGAQIIKAFILSV